MKKAYFVTYTAVVALVLLSIPRLSCNHGRPCMRLNVDLSQEPYGATDINAISGNQGLSVGFNDKGTITLFKWPNPSYYDQVKYMTTRRDAENMGALDNEGVFSGVYYEAKGERGFFWLRDAKVEQNYKSDRSVVVVTRFIEDRLGVEIEQVDFVDPEEDVLWRNYRVKRSPGSKVEQARLVSYLNFSPQVSKFAFFPLRDWCLDEIGSSSIEWEQDSDLFIQGKDGIDQSAKERSSVYLAFGYEQMSASHQAGYDGRCSAKRGFGKKDAFKLAEKGELPGSGSAKGQVTAGLVTDLTFNDQGVLMRPGPRVRTARSPRSNKPGRKGLKTFRSPQPTTPASARWRSARSSPLFSVIQKTKARAWRPYPPSRLTASTGRATACT
jgi:hypothetical protein